MNYNTESKAMQEPIGTNDQSSPTCCESAATPSGKNSEIEASTEAEPPAAGSVQRLVRLDFECFIPFRSFDMKGNGIGNPLEVRRHEGCILMPWLNLLFCPLSSVQSLGQESELNHYSAPLQICETTFYSVLCELAEKLKGIYPAEFQLLCDQVDQARVSKMWQPVSPAILIHALAHIQYSDPHILLEWKNHPRGLIHALLESFPCQRQHTIVGSFAYATGEPVEGEEIWINSWVSWANVQDEPTAESAQVKPAEAALEAQAGSGSAPSPCSGLGVGIR